MSVLLEEEMNDIINDKVSHAKHKTLHEEEKVHTSFDAMFRSLEKENDLMESSTSLKSR